MKKISIRTFMATGILALFFSLANWAVDTPSSYVFFDIKPGDVSLIASTAQRMVWNRQSGVVVAEIPSNEAIRFKRLVDSGKAQKMQDTPFEKMIEMFLPDYSEQSVRRSDGKDIYAVKTVVRMKKPEVEDERYKRPSSALKVEDGNCLSEDFEDYNLPIWFENGGNWWHYSNGSGNNEGDYFWLDMNCDSYSGSWSAESILGGDIGGGMQCGSKYDYNTESWMEYAPWITCASNSVEAYLDFYTTLKSETDYDAFYYLVTVDDSNYLGYGLSGNWSDAWYWIEQDLRHWYQLGDLSSYPQFGLAFVFESDNVINAGFGVRLDNIKLSTTAMNTVAGADPVWGKIPLEVHFTATVNGGTGPFSFRWEFGDGTAESTEQSPVHLYTTPGSYHVLLTVEDSEGNSATGALIVQANEPVIPVVEIIKKKKRPFRLVVRGNNLEKGIRVFIGGEELDRVIWKDSTKLILRGKSVLKNALPKGVPTGVLFENPDGSVTTYTFTR